MIASLAYVFVSLLIALHPILVVLWSGLFQFLFLSPVYPVFFSWFLETVLRAPTISCFIFLSLLCQGPGLCLLFHFHFMSAGKNSLDYNFFLYLLLINNGLLKGTGWSISISNSPRILCFECTESHWQFLLWNSHQTYRLSQLQCTIITFWLWHTSLLYVFTQPLHTCRVCHKVNCYVELNRSEFRVFLILD